MRYGLPATIIVTTTVRELEAGAGAALTGEGTLLPMSDVIRLASYAHHYLCILGQRQRHRAVPRQATGLTRSANYVVRQ